jgi:hypothetical protein
MCRWTGTLIADEHGIYDPGDSSDRMVLGVRGQVSELERDNSIHRMVEARWNKARRGELHYSPPAGYDLDDLGQVVLSCDEAVVEAIRTVFRKFDERGSARQILVWWREQGRKYPVRVRNGRSHPILWRQPTYGMVLRTLKHPIFAGAYVFGRSQTVRELDPEDRSGARGSARGWKRSGAELVDKGKPMGGRPCPEGRGRVAPYRCFASSGAPRPSRCAILVVVGAQI